MAVKENEGLKLGTFAGVFTPSILTILGIILFLRLGFVVGNAGLSGALAIIGIATLVSVLTSISLAAISTNIEVKGGGDYYLISRTLGAEFGGAIGLVLFLAQSVSVAFYAIGFAEATTAVVGVSEPWAVQAVALGSIAVLFVLAWAGADVATKFQFVIMGALIAALVSFYLGAFGSFDPVMAGDAITAPIDGVGFWVVFAIFFPAVTGFTQGVSMSGDLANASRSLPRGTFVAVGLSTVVYVSVAILLAGTTSQADLVNDTGQAMQNAALVGPAIVVGVVAATLSSAMASFLGAPRILQALASDRIIPGLGFFAKGVGPSSNPRRALLLTSAIAVVTVGLGSLNLIAPVVSMFFLISYGLLNYATYFESRAKSLYFRPRFKYFNKWLSLAGALLCMGAMLAINVTAGVVAALLLFGIYRFLASRETPERWADSGHAHYFQRAKESIAALASEISHPRNWRPQILAFSADPTRRARLLRFAKWLEGDTGITGAFQIVQGEGAEKRIEVMKEQEALQAQIDDLGIEAYGRAVLAADGIEALPVIVQAFGLGPLHANTVLFGWPESSNPQQRETFAGALRQIARLGVNVVTLSSDQERWEVLESTPQKSRRIDVLWSDDDTGRLAVLASYLATRTGFWEKAATRVLTVHEEAGDARGELEAILEEARIEAEVVVLPSDEPRDILAEAGDASMVLVPMRIRSGQLLDSSGRELEPLASQLPMMAAVLAGSPIQLMAQPDSGDALALVEAEEAEEEALRRVDILEKQLQEREAEVATLAAKVEDGPNGQAMLEAAERRLADTTRRTIKARTRAEHASERVSQLRGR